MKRRILVISAIILLLIAIFGLSKQIIASLQAGSRLDRATNEVSKLQQENQNLHKQLTEVNQPQYIEQEARNKLNLGQKGETIVIIPQSEIDKVLSASKKPVEIKIPNWQAWLNLIFN